MESREPVRENLCLLIGRAPQRDVLDSTRAAALGVPGVVGVDQLRAEYVTPDEVHLGVHLLVARGTPVEDADEIGSAAMDAIHEVVGGAYCLIGVDAEPETRVISDVI